VLIAFFSIRQMVDTENARIGDTADNDAAASAFAIGLHDSLSRGLLR
jgi:hypothetical protein